MNLPNLLSGLRLLLVPPLIYLTLHGEYFISLIIIAFAAASDLADGALARALQQQSKLGKYLDAVADKFLIAGCFLSLHILTIIPGWLFWLVLSRDLCILFGSLHMYRHKVSRENIRVRWTGKVTTGMQMVTVLLALLDQYRSLPIDLELLYLLCGLATGVSWLHYGLNYGRAIQKALGNKRVAST